MPIDELTIDDVFKLAKEQGLKPRPWSWSKLKTYNSFNHAQRDRKWQTLDLAVRMGLEPPANTLSCAVCDKTSPTISCHSEDYSRLSGHYPLCKSCHTRIHQRFKNPVSWQAYIADFGDGIEWFHRLAMEEAL